MCGSCLDVTGTPLKKISLTAAMAFREITEFGTLSDYICDGCQITLRNYVVFKSLVKQKHTQIRADLERNNFMGKKLEDIDLPSNEEDPLLSFSCKSCEFKSPTLLSLKNHEKSKHSSRSEQQSFQKIQIQVADEDYDFMSQILNTNQLEQVKITENSSAANEEAGSSSTRNDLPFKIAKVDSWAPYKSGSMSPQKTEVKKKRRKMFTAKRTVPEELESDPLGDDFMSNSEFIMNYAQNYKKLDEFMEDNAAEPKELKKRKKLQPQDDTLPFYCDLCGYSSSDRNFIIEHIHKAHPGTSNGTGKLSMEIPASSISVD